MNVLIVEDSEDRLNILAKLYLCHNVTVCRTAAKAIQALSASSFDVVQLDYDLSGNVKGERVAQYISDNELPPVVIIHSEHPEGSQKMRAILPHAFKVPISSLQSKNRFMSQWKALLSNPLTHLDLSTVRSMLTDEC